MKVHVNKLNYISLKNLCICSTELQILCTGYIDASHSFGMLRKSTLRILNGKHMCHSQASF